MVETQDAYPLSVVIATLGGDPLVDTIACLNRGARAPSEILICIPAPESARVRNLGFTNVRVIETPCRGQVAQRAYGLQRSHYPLVMQMDDDIILPPDDLQRLVEALTRMGGGNAIAPLYSHLNTGGNITKIRSGRSGWKENLLATLVCGAPWGARRMGVISPAGVGYGVDEAHCGGEPVVTQWLPGGCVICHQQDLVTEDYYPFPGKAYTEDLVHSLLWRKCGVRLWVLPTARCMTTVAEMPFSRDALRAQFMAHEHVVRGFGGSLWRLRLWYFVLATMHQAKILFRGMQAKGRGGLKKPGAT